LWLVANLTKQVRHARVPSKIRMAITIELHITG